MDDTETSGFADRALLNLTIDFDLDALREKYALERGKRIRSEGVGQYVEIKGELSRYAVDPHVEPGFTRAPLNEAVDVLIVGGGFGGLLAAVRLRQAGFHNIRIVEKAGDFGGVWYWNRYPGAQCDTESSIYLPLLEETGYVPPIKYVSGDDIRAHARRIGEMFDLYPRTSFQTAVAGMTWVEDQGRWLVTTDRGDRVKARHVISASGPMEKPKLPGIPGIARFKGHAFHTSRWDYGYTGGDNSGGLDRLADKRVAVVGTGCTGIQCIPHLGRDAKHLYVFQRTPSTIDSRKNTPTDPEWVAQLAPGWQRRRNENFTGLVQGGLQLGDSRDADMVKDEWTENASSLNAVPPGMSAEDFAPEDLALAAEVADFRRMNALRARVDVEVSDPATAQALKPWYKFMCKRPGFSDEYLQTFNRPNVTLVDTLGRGVDAVTETGLVFDGVEYPVDCIIFATGFEVGTGYARRAGFEIHGRDGRTLSEHWSDSVRTYQGYYTHGFPNYFHMGPVQGGISTNIPHLLDEQSRHIAELLQIMRTRGAVRVEATAEAETQWIATVRERGKDSRAFWESCTPGYFNTEGKLDSHGLIENVYNGAPLEYFRMMQDWRQSGSFDGLQIA